MKSSPLSGAFTATPENCYRAMMDAARGVSVSQRHTKRPLRAAAVAIALLLALAGAAYALSGSSVFRYLIGMDTPGSGLEAISQQPRGEAASDGITISISGFVYDGERLALAFQAYNEQPESAAFIRLVSLKINGEEHGWLHATASSQSPMMIPFTGLDILPVQRNPAIGGITSQLLPTLNDAVSCEAEFVVERPQKGLVFIEEALWDNLSGYDEEQRMAWKWRISEPRLQAFKTPLWHSPRRRTHRNG